jgi:mycothiol synthase
MAGQQVTVVTAPDTVLEKEVTALLDRAARANGHAGLSEHKRITLLHSTDDRGRSPGNPTLVAGLVARATGGHAELVGYAPVVGDTTTRRYAVEVVVEPTADDPSALADALVDAGIELVVGLGGGTLRLWSFVASDADDARASARGLRLERNLIQMRCPLPLPDAVRGRGPAISTREFRPGQDEAAWLVTNNRAFGSHPEQGHWQLADIVAREQEPWFDPGGLLLLEEDGRVAGSCWTKVHADADPPMGEIYVIGIDPDFRGRGWGRALTEAGLDWLARRGLTIGMLYVDADNAAALSLYRSMGFVEDHVDRAYVGHFG